MSHPWSHSSSEQAAAVPADCRRTFKAPLQPKPVWGAGVQPVVELLHTAEEHFKPSFSIQHGKGLQWKLSSGELRRKEAVGWESVVPQAQEITTELYWFCVNRTKSQQQQLLETGQVRKTKWELLQPAQELSKSRRVEAEAMRV